MASFLFFNPPELHPRGGQVDFTVSRRLVGCIGLLRSNSQRSFPILNSRAEHSRSFLKGSDVFQFLDGENVIDP
jgi:hypothetical protein